MNNVIFGNQRFGYYETVCGGAGAGPGFDGADAVHTHMTNTRITDPEVIVHSYEQYGEACVDRMRGMFAFAVWDQRNRRLLIARDRLGKKPLYYTEIAERFARC